MKGTLIANILYSCMPSYEQQIDQQLVSARMQHESIFDENLKTLKTAQRHIRSQFYPSKNIEIT